MMNYKTVPYKHQDDAVRIMMGMPVFALYDDMGTGKSKAMVDTMCAVAMQNEIPSTFEITGPKVEAAVIVAPNSVKRNWGHDTRGQIIQHGWDNLEHQVYVIEARKKLWPVERFQHRQFQWIIVNYESVWRPRVYDWLADFMKSFKTAMILDESQRIKTPGINQTKGCTALGKLAVRRYLLSGTPITKNPLDYFTQFRFLDPDITGYRTFSTFRLRYAEMVPTTIGARSFQKVVGFQRVDELLEKVGPYYRRVLKTDCLDLPNKVYERLEVELSEDQAKAYKDMQHKMVMEHAGQKVKAPIALTKMLRLLQITSGYVNSDTGMLRIGKTSPKVETIANLVDDHPRQAVIFFREHMECALLREALFKRDISYTEIHGKVDSVQRKINEDAFQAGEYKVILCQVGTGGIGIDLWAADLVIYISNSPSLEHRQQSEDRAMRIGQVRKVTYVDVCATLNGIQTLDHVGLRAIELKQDLADLVLKNVDDLARFFDELYAES
jgi:SNF2 family DNA or RNA helicase